MEIAHETRRIVSHRQKGAAAQTVRVLDDDRLKALADDGDLPFIQAVLKSWDGVEGDDGRPQACTPEAVAALCRYAIARQAILKTYWEGLQQAAEGN